MKFDTVDDLLLDRDSFPIVYVADVCSVGDGAHSKVNRTADGVPYLTSKNVGLGVLKLDKFDRISVDDYEKLFPQKSRATRRPMFGDVLIGIIGTFGNAYLYTQFDNFGVASSVGILRPDPQKLDPRFLYYVITSSKFKTVQANHNAGSAQGYTNIAAIKKLQLPLPPLPQQYKIAALLGVLDDRIALLRETNRSLEDIGRAIFKSWFVDFDPVRAKQDGRVPEGMGEATAAMFSDGFEESELGAVPRGWRITSVSDIAEVVKGKSYSSKDLVESHDTALVTLKSFARGGGFRLDGFKPYSGAYKPSQVVVPGDLIVAYTDVTQAAELIGKPAIVVGIESHRTLVASLDVGIIRPDEAKVSRQYLYGLFRTDLFQCHTLAHTSGTTVLHLAKDGVGSFRFACPPKCLVNEFSVVAELLAGRVQTNINQMRILANLRDALLPRLISGKLRLPGAVEERAELLTGT